MLPAQPNQSLIDGLACLQALAVSTEPVGNRALARQLGLEPTRVNRLLKTLAHLGMARQNEERKYLPGPAMHVLSAMSLFGSGLVRRAITPLESLHPLADLVALGVLWREHVCYLYHAERGMRPELAIGRVGLFPATQSSIGRVLLAHQEEAQIRELYDGHEIPDYPSLPALLEDLAKIREQGYAYVERSSGPYQSAVGVPIGSPSYAAVALTPVTPDKLDQVLPALRRVADAIGHEKHKQRTPA